MLIYPTVILVFLQFCFNDAEDLTVTVAVFSGSPDPIWRVPSSNQPIYGTIKRMLAGAKKFQPRNMPARLGYKGFLVQEGTNEQYLIVGPETQQLQLKLLETMPKDLPGDSSLLDGNIQQIKKEMKSVNAEFPPSTSAASTLRSKRYAPDYLPQEWYLSPFIRRCNNCYNYANARRTNTFSLPGAANGQVYQLNNPQSVRNAAQADGLLPVNPPIPLAAPAGPRHLVALVVDPGVPNVRRGDFHWYRLDGNWNVGKWSHKPGETVPTNRDNDGRPITDPSNPAVAMGYYQFITFMTTDRNTVNIQTNYQCA